MMFYIVSMICGSNAPRGAVVALACGLLSAATALPTLAAEAIPGPIPARVVRVVDGDTVVVRARIWPGHEVETAVRLAGVDAPERRGECPEAAEAARRRLEELAGEQVALWAVVADKYGGRMRARITGRDGADLGTTLAAEGLARRYHGAGPAGWCP